MGGKLQTYQILVTLRLLALQKVCQDVLSAIKLFLGISLISGDGSTY